MTDDLHKRAEEIVGAMTPGPWRCDPCWSNVYLPPHEFITWSYVPATKHYTADTRLAEHNYKPAGDKRGIALLRNMAEATQAVVRAADDVRDYCGYLAKRPSLTASSDATSLHDLFQALAAYDAALARELGDA